MNIEELEKKKIELFQRAQTFIQEHFKLMGRIEEINEQIRELNGSKEKEKEESSGE